MYLPRYLLIITNYSNRSDTMFSNIYVSRDTISCHDINCKNPQHGTDLCDMYEHIVKSLLASSGSLCKTSSHSISPDWNDFVSKLHAEARRAFKTWAVAGKIRQGPLFDYKKSANAKFKYAIRFIKSHENTLRLTLLRGSCIIISTRLWQEHYSELFNCHK